MLRIYEHILAVTLATAANAVAQQAQPPGPRVGPSIFAALKALLSRARQQAVFGLFRTQLGLKLESAREAVDCFVIDHAERPSENCYGAACPRHGD